MPQHHLSVLEDIVTTVAVETFVCFGCFADKILKLFVLWQSLTAPGVLSHLMEINESSLDQGLWSKVAMLHIHANN